MSDTNKDKKSMVIVSVAYQVRDEPDGIYADTRFFQDMSEATEHVRNCLTQISEEWHDGEDFWTAENTVEEVEKIMGNADKTDVDDIIYRWVDYYQAYAYRVQKITIAD